MTTGPDYSIRAARAVREAIAFMSQYGRADVYLARHHPTSSGWCECGTHRWPCPVAALAEVAARKAARNDDRAAAARTAPESIPAPPRARTSPLSADIGGVA